MSNVCPKGHYSTDQDYCSECGTPIELSPALVATPRSRPGAGGAANPVATASGAGVAGNCPDCMTQRPADARYCEVCRFDFTTRTSFSGLSSAGLSAAAAAPAPAPVPAAAPAPAAAAAWTVVSPSAVSVAQSPAPKAALLQPRAAAPAPVAPAGNGHVAAVAQRLLLRIQVDPSLYTDPEPDMVCPVGAPERVFHLDLDENTVGRQYEGKGIHPEIVVPDPGISRRHLKFVRGADGRFSVLELGSANGADFNGAALEPGVLMPVQPGDQITLGMWTRIRVEAR